MTGKEYLRSLENISVDEAAVRHLAAIYSGNFPEILMKIISNAEKPTFLSDGSRVLSYEEMAEAEQDLHVPFSQKRMVPVMDCGENDFIVYHMESRIWSKFNIVDEIVFQRCDSLEALLK